jgi:hypothetical protein
MKMNKESENINEGGKRQVVDKITYYRNARKELRTKIQR